MILLLLLIKNVIHGGLFRNLLLFLLFTKLIFKGPCIKNDNPDYFNNV